MVRSATRASAVPCSVIVTLERGKARPRKAQSAQRSGSESNDPYLRDQ